MPNLHLPTLMEWLRKYFNNKDKVNEPIYVHIQIFVDRWENICAYHSLPFGIRYCQKFYSKYTSKKSFHLISSTSTRVYPNSHHVKLHCSSTKTKKTKKVTTSGLTKMVRFQHILYMWLHSLDADEPTKSLHNYTNYT